MFNKLKSKTGAVSVVVVTIILAIILTAAITAVVMRVIADQTEKPIFTVTDMELNVGKYYFNGDTKSYYYEVFDDKTIQLGGIDPIDYYWSYETIAAARDNGFKTDEEWLKKYCEEDLGARRYYTIVINHIDSERMMLCFYKEPPEKDAMGSTSMTLIDINNIENAEKVFTYVKG